MASSNTRAAAHTVSRPPSATPVHNMTLQLYSLHAWNTQAQGQRLQIRLCAMAGVQHAELDAFGESIHITYAAPADVDTIEYAVRDCGLFTSSEDMVREYQAWQTFLAHDDLGDA